VKAQVKPLGFFIELLPSYAATRYHNPLFATQVEKELFAAATFAVAAPEAALNLFPVPALRIVWAAPEKLETRIILFVHKSGSGNVTLLALAPPPVIITVPVFSSTVNGTAVSATEFAPKRRVALLNKAEIHAKFSELNAAHFLVHVLIVLVV